MHEFGDRHTVYSLDEVREQHRLSQDHLEPGAGGRRRRHPGRLRRPASPDPRQPAQRDRAGDGAAGGAAARCGQRAGDRPRAAGAGARPGRPGARERPRPRVAAGHRGLRGAARVRVGPAEPASGPRRRPTAGLAARPRRRVPAADPPRRRPRGACSRSGPG
nr:hypothetical protein [Angustibacter aerolatus]